MAEKEKKQEEKKPKLPKINSLVEGEVIEIGKSVADTVVWQDKRKKTILIEGDGGFAMNLQELETAVRNQLRQRISLST